ncbi:UvrD-helicase domain protein [Ceratobasidium sp. AG-Ba]|nr:UvrD-helicase domain protein [Ceratobasidium sp. AG-Ba]
MGPSLTHRTLWREMFLQGPKLRSAFVTSRTFSDAQEKSHLEGLSDAQRKAVTSPPGIPLQVLAGPGSGKTKVLTARIVELIKTHKQSPANICAVTFTRKAAHEMRVRVEDQIGSTATRQLSLGTFHSVCVQLLRDCGSFVGIQEGFAIWDEDDCDRILYHILAFHDVGIDMDTAREIREKISKLKGSIHLDPKTAFSKDTYPWMADVFKDYQNALRISKALDFEDLLRSCLHLFRKAPWIPRLVNLQHVLVDEFQDTSELQYHLIRTMFESRKRGITIVGDPDQAIYGWRNADIANFERMKKDLTNTKENLLEENYRSTGSILAFSHAIIAQDTERPQKSLFTNRTPNGPKPVLKGLETSIEQAEYMAEEIQRLVDTSNGLFGYGDFAALFRANHSWSHFAKALEDRNIPFRILRETPWYKRYHCKILLGYLRVAMDLADTPSVCLVLEGGPPFVERKYISPRIWQSIREQRSLFDVLSQMCDADRNGNSLSNVKIRQFIQLIRTIRIMANTGADATRLLEYIVRMTDYYAFLDRLLGHSAAQEKKDVQRLIQHGYKMSGRQLLRNLRDLSKDTHHTANRVTIGTVHSAKGLEWPVVLVPNVGEGVYPHRKSDTKEDINEERYLSS